MSGWWDILHLRNFNVKHWSNSTDGKEVRMNEHMNKKDENYIPLGINAGGKNTQEEPQSQIGLFYDMKKTDIASVKNISALH